VRLAGGEDDPTVSPLAKFANVLQGAITNSPINELKKVLNKLSQAGRLAGSIFAHEAHSCVLLSFLRG
jgi:hypothetical protein